MGIVMTRKRKAIAIAVALFTVTGVAVAFVNLRGGVNGSVGNPNCLVTVNNPGVNGNEITVTWSQAIPGDLCRITPDYLADANNDAAIVWQGFVAPSGLIAHDDAIGAVCGVSIAPGATEPIGVSLEFDGTAETVAFDPLVHGFYFVRTADFDPALCPAP